MTIMKKNYLLSMALAAMVSCSSEEFTGEQTVREVNENVAISFNLDVPAITRAEDQTGSTAATTLGNQFIVWGEKNELTTGAAAAATNVVFKNYLVNYTASTAYTTTSNTKDWEYVGLTYNNATYSDTYSSNVSPLTSTASSAAQTIKYWDYSATNYVFTAVSAKGADITAGNVKITKTENSTSSYNKGYTVVLTADADPTKLFFSDRQVITPTAGTNREAENAYGGNVRLKFRNATSQIRVGMYETIPGHTVKIDKFYYVNSDAPTFSTMTTEGRDAFYANVPNITTDKAVTLTVTYKSDASVKNQPSIAVAGTGTGEAGPNNYIKLGGGFFGTTSNPVYLGTSATSPTWDKSGNYTLMFSQEANSQNLKLKVDYTLTAEDTGEEIHVVGATAEIPYQYLQWKPNYKYTYLFKINDNTNGSTGQGVVGLYPITFDAVAVVAEDGTAEYITTVSEPSITTFGVKDGKYTTGKNEYEVGTDIYITIVNNSSVINPAFMSDTHLYKVTTSDGTNFPITEASVAEAYDHKSGNKISIGGCICTPWSNAGKASKVTSVPAEDGTTITSMYALKFSPASGDEGTYAVQYSYGSTDYTYTAVDATGWTSETSVNGLYVFDGASTPTYTPATGTYDSSKTYYDRTVSGTGTKRVYKIIKVVSASGS